MDTNVCFSIITVCKNDVFSLSSLKTELENQTFRNFEWIVIDGCSSDGTQRFLSSVDFPRMQWISEEDSGIYDAMNKGISLSTGTFVQFLNSGDTLYDHETLEKVAKCLGTDDNVDIVYGDCVDIGKTQRIYKRCKSLSYIRHGLPCSHQSMFFRRESVRELRYDFRRYPVAADYAFVAEMNVLGRNRVIYLDFPICLFKLGGMSSTNRNQLLKDSLHIQHDILNLPLKDRLFSFCYRWLAMRLIDGNERIYSLLRKYFDKLSDK